MVMSREILEILWQKVKKNISVNNKEFLEALIDYKADCRCTQREQVRTVTRYIGECFLKIAQHLSYRPNFINYTYKHDMISDAY